MDTTISSLLYFAYTLQEMTKYTLKKLRFMKCLRECFRYFIIVSYWIS